MVENLYAEKNDEVDVTEKIPHLRTVQPLRDEMRRFGVDRIENELEWKYVTPKLLKAYEVSFTDI